MLDNGQDQDRLTAALAADIDALTNGLERFMTEDEALELPRVSAGSPLEPLARKLDQMRLKHLKLLKENEVQTVGEGEFEIKRRNEMRRIAADFNDNVGAALKVLISQGHKGREAASAASGAVHEAVSSAGRVDEVIKVVAERAQSSGETVKLAAERAVEAIDISNDVKDAATQIVRLVGVIDSISFQTTLLALNAAIEAARAGEHGAGFRVVADAVKRLAEDTSEAAGKVKTTAIGMKEEAERMAGSVGSIKTASDEVSVMTEKTIEAVSDQVTATKDITQRAEASSRSMGDVEREIDAIEAGAGQLKERTSDFVRMVTAEPGVTSEAVTFGQSAPFSGVAASLGLGTRQGIELAFEEISGAGGIFGRALRLQALDDAYDPDRALENVRTLVRGGDVFGLVGAVGTPTSKLSERIARGGRVPFVGPVTGTGFLREKDRAHVLNVRASYDDEAAALVGHFEKLGRLEHCALFYQADAYGASVRASLEKALSKLGRKLEVFAPYSRMDNDVAAAVETVCAAAPTMVFMSGTSGPTAKFITQIRGQGLDPSLATISFVGAADFARQVGSAGAGVVVSQVVPNPSDTQNPLVQSYLGALAQHKAELAPDFAMLEGYVIGHLLGQLLKAAGEWPTREALLKAALGAPTTFDIFGHSLTYGPGQNYGSRSVHLTELGRNSEYLSIGGSGTAAISRLAS